MNRFVKALLSVLIVFLVGCTVYSNSLTPGEVEQESQQGLMRDIR